MANLDELVGQRVALRHRVAAPDTRELFTDAVGELALDSPDAVLVHTRRGVVRVRRDAVVAVRAVPPPRPRRASLASVARLENLCADAWPPMLVRPLGQWRLRAAGGFTGRANSALAVGEPGVPIPAALAEVRGFAAQHELTPMVATALDTPWQRAVLGQGWLPHHEHPAGPRSAVLVTPLGRLAEQSTPGEVQLSIDDDPHPAWWELAGQRPITDAQRHVLGAPGLPQVGFGLARVAGTPVGAVRAVVLDEHLYAARLVVSAQHRRRGLGVALMAASARWAQQRGAGWCVLQVAERNAAALAFYRSLGFTVHHRYEYLRPPAMTR